MTINASETERAAGESYEALFVPSLFGAWTPHLLDAAQVQQGDTVLDIACGTGILTRAAAERAGANVTGLDPAAGMLAVASDKASSLAWTQGTAENLPFPDAHFDVVLSQFGMMFFTDRAQAAQEMYRVLKPGGRLAIAVWGQLAANPVYQRMAALFAREISQDAANALALPFSLGDPADAIAPFAETAFTGTQIKQETEQANFPSLRILIEAELRGWLPLFDIHVNDALADRVLSAATAALNQYADHTGAARFPTSAHILTARKPL